MSGPYWNGRGYETSEDRERNYEPCRWRDEKIKKLQAVLKEIRTETDVSPGERIPVGKIWRLANIALTEEN